MSSQGAVWRLSRRAAAVERGRAVALDQVWWVPLSIFVVSQAVAALAIRHASGGAYETFVARWDGGFYTRIAREGYPSDPATDGYAAFYPLYPMVVRFVASITPLGVTGAGVLVSVVAAGAGVVVLFRTVDRHVDRAAAVATAVMVCAWMAAPVLQMTYSEGLALLLLALAFDCLLRARYGLLLAVLLPLALCRPLVTPFVVVIAVHCWARWRSGAADRWRAVFVLALCVPLVVLWPMVAWIVTGVPGAYFEAMGAFQIAGRARSWALLLLQWGPLGWVLGLGVMAVLLWVVARGLPRECPVEYRVWAVVYPLYVMGATYISGSVVRYMLFAFPFAFLLAPLARRGRTGWVVLSVLGLVGSALGVYWVHHFVGRDFGMVP